MRPRGEGLDAETSSAWRDVERPCGQANAGEPDQPGTSANVPLHPIPSSFPMIGVVRKDRGGAEQLLGEHGAGEQVWPGRLAEGEQQVGAPALGIAEAVGGADQESRLA